MIKSRSILAAAAVLGATLLPTQPVAAERTIQSPLMVSGSLTDATVAPGSNALWAAKVFGKNTPKVVSYRPGAAAWSIHDPTPGDPDSIIGSDIAMASDTDGWILTPDELWHWDGADWARNSLPANAFDIRWMDSGGSDDVWLAGWNGGYDGENCIWHWDGTSWQRFVLSPGSASGQTHGLVAVAPDNVWAIEELTGTRPQRLWHWDGESWTQRSIPGLEFLFGLAANASDVWVDGDGGPIQHWDGQKWTTIPNAPGGLYEFEATSDGELWGHGADGLVHNVDGAWTVHPYPEDTCSPNRTADLLGIAVRADGGVYLTGTCYFNYGSTTLAYLFDGESFTRV